MILSASVMTQVPFPVSLVVFLVAFIVVGSLVVAGFVVRDSLKNRQKTHLDSINENPELEPFNLTPPVPKKAMNMISAP